MRVCRRARLCADDESESPNRSEEHTSELQSQSNLVCRLLLEKKKEQDLSEPMAGLLDLARAQAPAVDIDIEHHFSYSDHSSTPILLQITPAARYLTRAHNYSH